MIQTLNGHAPNREVTLWTPPGFDRPVRAITNRVKPLIAPRIGSISGQVKRLNNWRDFYNPLRNFTFSRGVPMLETYRLGWFAELQWTYSFLEETDEDLFALVERRISAIKEMDWNIKLCDDDPAFNQSLADEQSAALREAYERIDNLYEAIEHLAMASFRGFSFLEKQTLKGDDVDHLEIVDHWNLVRDGFRGDWKYNPSANQVSYDSLPGPALPYDRFIHREVKRHIDRVALIKYLRTALAMKDWTAFIEIYGIPSGIAIMPPNVPPGKEDEYRDAAQKASEGVPVGLPNGSDYKPNESPRGTNPFKEFLAYLSEKLILAGTGGKLTMLAESGSGTLAGSVHKEAFETIGRAEARDINQSFNRDFDAEILETNFPGRPRLAYWELAAQEETETSEICAEVLQLSQAGYEVDSGELSEKTGYTLQLKPPVAPANPAFGGNKQPVQNRDGNLATDATAKDGELSNAVLDQVFAARVQRNKPLLERLAQLDRITNAGELRQAILALQKDLPNLADQLHADQRLPELLNRLMQRALLAGVEDGIHRGDAETRRKQEVKT